MAIRYAQVIVMSNFMAGRCKTKRIEIKENGRMANKKRWKSVNGLLP